MSEFIGTQSITACAWIYPEGWGGNNLGRIIDNKRFAFYLWDVTTSLKFTSNYATHFITSANGSIVLNKWQFVCISRNTDGDEANFYIDGALSGPADQNSGTPDDTLTTNVIIGNNGAGDRTFDGKIDEVRIYSEVLSSSQIQKLYVQGAEKHDLLVRE